MNLLDNCTTFSTSSTDEDALEALVRKAARQMLQAALEAEVNDYLQRQPQQRCAPEGAFRGYRNGPAKQRTLTVGSGTIKVKAPRVAALPEGQTPFASHILKPYQRRSRTLAEVFPKLFIEGLATRDFESAWRCLLGQEAALSPATVSRLNAPFKGEYDQWLQSSLADLPIVSVWVDGLYLVAGLGEEKACLLVMIGADASGQKHLLALEEGFRESKESWLGVLRRLRQRGMNEPAAAVGDGALGFWAAASELWRQSKQPRCWVHKVSNILDKLPQRERDEAAKSLRAIYLSKSREEARQKAAELARSWRGLYDKAAECLLADLERLLTFFEYPEDHWRQLRTTNPIESVLAAVRLRTNAMKRLRGGRRCTCCIRCSSGRSRSGSG